MGTVVCCLNEASLQFKIRPKMSQMGQNCTKKWLCSYARLKIYYQKFSSLTVSASFWNFCCFLRSSLASVLFWLCWLWRLGRTLTTLVCWLSWQSVDQLYNHLRQRAPDYRDFLFAFLQLCRQKTSLRYNKKINFKIQTRHKSLSRAKKRCSYHFNTTNQRGKEHANKLENQITHQHFEQT